MLQRERGSPYTARKAGPVPCSLLRVPLPSCTRAITPLRGFVASWLRGFLLLAFTGCTGTGSVHMVSLATRKINPAEPLVITVKPGECYYWRDERDRLCLALREFRGSLFSRVLERETLISFVLGEPPAATSREYPVNTSTFRWRRRGGLTHLRAGSLNGVVAVWDYGKRTLRGRFRLTIRQQSYSVLTGWSGDARYIVVGEFQAVRDAERGQAILKRTEEDAMQREPLRPL